MLTSFLNRRASKVGATRNRPPYLSAYISQKFWTAFSLNVLEVILMTSEHIIPSSLNVLEVILMTSEHIIPSSDIRHLSGCAGLWEDDAAQPNDSPT
jgi:hypothetical protein